MSFGQILSIFAMEVDLLALSLAGMHGPGCSPGETRPLRLLLST